MLTLSGQLHNPNCALRKQASPPLSSILESQCMQRLSWRFSAHLNLASRTAQSRSCHSRTAHRATATSVVQETAHASSDKAAYEAVIGIESHVRLNTRTKAFCGCANEYGAKPNTHVCPICLAHPGTLPILNEEAVQKAIVTGLALQCTVHPHSKFDRKQYIYPDLPKGYQISQYDVPIAEHGHLNVDLPDGTSKCFGITRAHMEEDSGKLVHYGAVSLSGSDYSLCDYNRAGTPLLEIVSEPDMRSGQEAAAYASELRRIMRFIGTSDGNMQDGSMRCDVNVSVRPHGQEAFGTKVEIKNMNTFGGMQKAIDYEIDRQVTLLGQGRGEEIVLETRLYDEAKQVTRSMRKKEGLADYRYFPEPDLPPLGFTQKTVDHLQASMAELPAAKRARFMDMGLPRDDVLILAEDLETAQYFDAVLAEGAPAKLAVNWIVGDVMAHCKNTGESMGSMKLQAATLAAMVKMIESKAISGKIGKQLLPELLQGKGSGAEGVQKLVDAMGGGQISDAGYLAEILDKVIANNQKQLEQYRGGKNKLKGHFVGQAMKETKGKADPVLLNKLLMERLDAA